jgi:hypothetical protein
MRIQQWLLAAALLGAFFVSSESQAAPHARDGFYLSLNTGFGPIVYSSTANYPVDEQQVEYKSHFSGATATSSLLLGLPLRPGLVLGVGGLTSFSWLASPDRTANGQKTWQEDGGGPYVKLWGLAGPFVDYYPSAALGWHVQALVGYASFFHSGDVTRELPDGIGLMAGVGQDWWISDRWSVGILARVTYANMHVTGGPYPDYPQGTPTERDTVISPSLEASFTWH